MSGGWRKRLGLVLELGKIRIARLVTLSTATGYIAYRGQLSLEMLIPLLGIFLMALGSAALNQYQEWQLDARMARTRQRPIPSGRLRPVEALRIALGLLLAGTLILGIGVGWLPMALGILAAVWYNGIYTPLKRVSPLAAVPGAVIGAVPPLVGWVSAGGAPGDRIAVALVVLFFFWQIPHFWLLLLNFGGDYREAGYPTLSQVLTRAGLSRVTFMWIVATAVVMLLLPLFGVVRYPVLMAALAVVALGLVLLSLPLLRPNASRSAFRMAFIGINSVILLVMILISLNSLWHVG